MLVVFDFGIVVGWMVRLVLGCMLVVEVINVVFFGMGLIVELMVDGIVLVKG